MNQVTSTESHMRLGFARAEITPPVGIYHRMWGAARHDRATGIHRPVYGDVMVLGPIALPPGDLLIRVNLDLVGLVNYQHDALIEALCEGAGGGITADRVTVTYSHTHSSGWFVPDRFGLPGGELIEPYLAELGGKLRQACREAVSRMREVTISYARGQCAMAANRDFWDEELGGFACGFNPDGVADGEVVVGRITDADGGTVASLVHYACHPTTLAWENTLISPDYVGALREEVERATGAPCTFMQGACGDLGPRHGFVGDPEVAEANGRELAYAALSALTALGPPATDFCYSGPVVSGATLGTWAPVPLSGERIERVQRFAGGAYTVDLPCRSGMDRGELAAELASWSTREQESEARGDAIEVRDCRAHAERARRWLGRLDDLKLSPGHGYSLRFSVHLLGDAVWCTCGGEPYNLIQRELRRRFPELTVILSPLAGDLQVAYLLARDCYGKGLYQEEPSCLAPGCLELLTEAMADRIEAVCGG